MVASRIDEQIVQMRFENSQFESEARKTIGTIDQLRQSTDSLGDNTAAFDPLITALEKVGGQFSAVETIATGALLRIGYQAEALAERMVKSLTIDQVTAGWTKYEEKTKSVKTIMNATGESIETVNSYLDKLMWYTDETSYNFTDMTDNIGKFTAQGIKLEDATTAMMGIANWAADAGQGVNEASRAMYNLSQSLGMGQVRLTDWMSIENANMATKDFKEQVIQTAIELGTLTEEAKNAKGEVVNFGNFREMLQTGFFTSDVLIETLRKYGDYSEEVFKITQEEGILASEAMERLGDSYEGVGERAFKAAQVSKTFSDSLDATKDAVSSGWLTTFEHLLGNLETQEVLWTQVTEVMWELFAASGEARNELLQVWEDMGGQLVFLDTIGLLLDGIVGFMDLIGNAWGRAFPPMSAQTLFDLTVRLRDFVASLELTEWASENIADAIGGVLNVFKAIGQVAFAVIKGFAPGVETLNDFAGQVVEVAGSIGRALTAFSEFITTEEHLAAITEFVRSTVGGLANVLTSLSEAITGVDINGDGLATNFGGFFASIFESIQDTVNSSGGLLNIFSDIFQSVFDKIQSIFSAIADNEAGSEFLSAFGETIVNVSEKMRESVPVLSTFITALSDLINVLTTGLAGVMSDISGTVDWDEVFGLASLIALIAVLDKLNDLNPAGQLGDLLDTIKETISQFKFKLFVESMKAFSEAIAILAGSIILLGSMPLENACVATALMVGIGFGLKKFIDYLQGIDTDHTKNLGKLGPSLLAISGALLILSAAISKIGSLDPVNMVLSVAALGAVMLELQKFSTAMSGVNLSVGNAAGLIAYVAALDLLVPAVKSLGSLSLGDAVVGLSALAAMLVEISLFAKQMQGVTIPPGTAISLIAMVSAVDMLAIAVAGLGSLDLPSIGKGLLAVAGVMAEIGVFAALLQNVKASGATVSLIAMAAAIDLLVPAFVLLGQLQLSQIGSALLAIGGALVEFVAAAALLSFVGPQALAASAGILALSVAVAALVPVITVLGALPMDVVKQGLLTIAAAIGIFVAAAYLLTPISATLTGLAASFSLIAIGAAAVIAAFGLLAGSLTNLAAGFILFGSMSADTVRQACDNIKIILDELIMWLVGAYVKFKAANLVMFAAFIDALVELAPRIVNGVLSILNDILQALVEWGPELFAALMDLLTVLDQYMEPLGEKAVELIGSFLAGLIKGLEKGIENVVGAIVDAGKRLFNSFKNALFGGGAGTIEATGEQMAKDAANGLASGAKKSEKTAAKAGASTAQAYLDAHDEKMDRHSPSKEMEKRGEDASEGFAQGSKKTLFKFKDSATEGATTFLSSLGETLFGKKSSKGNSGEGGAVGEIGEKTGSTFASSVEKSGGGTKAAKSLAKQIDEDKELEKAAKEQAKKVAEAFTTEFNKISSQLSAVGSKFSIAEAYLGPEDDEGKIAKKKALLELQKMQEELAILGDKYNISWDKYQNTLANPKSSNEEVQSMYAEYLKVYEELAQKASAVAAQQKELYGTYEEAEQIVMAELRELQSMQAQLVDSAEVEASKATQEAYNNFVAAVTEEQKQYYYDLWNELKKADAEAVLGEIIAAPIDVDKVRKEVYSQLGLDPNNPVEAFLSVEDLIGQAVGISQQTYLAAVEATYPDIVNSYESKLAESADEVLEFVDAEVAPKYARSGEMMTESTASGITDATPKVEYSAKDMSTDAAQSVRRTTPEWQEVGIGMMDGVIQGIEDRRAEVIEAAIQVAIAALNAAKRALGIASPSREFLAVGMYAIDGLRIGIIEGKEPVEDATQSVATGMVDQFDDVGDRISRILDDSLHPVIDPTLDLTGVKRAAKNLDNIWSSGTLRTLSDISLSELSRRDEILGLRELAKPVVNNTYTFTQNNTSPKALSDAEIYRQTKKELDWAFKGAPR